MDALAVININAMLLFSLPSELLFVCLLLLINGLIESPSRIIKFQIHGLDFFFFCRLQQFNYQAN